MTEQIHIGAAMANQVGATADAAAAISCRRRGASRCSVSSTMLQLIDAILVLWPHKPIVELIDKTKRSERTCQYWLSRRYEIKVDDLAKLLRTDDGLVFLEAVMGDARPLWWKAFKKQMRLAETNRRLIEARRELDRLNQEDD